MGASGVDWRDHDAIRRWMTDWAEEAANGGLSFKGNPDAEQELRHRFARGDFAEANARSVEAFLAQLDRESYRESAAGQADREERATAAAEASAEYAKRSLEASERSAAAAERSSRWGGWAVAIALAALFVGAWQFIRT